MPHSTSAQDEEGDQLFSNILTSGSIPADLGNIWDREVDQRDKAEDAKDFEDISDDDLADEEEARVPEATTRLEGGVEDEDLFGDGDAAGMSIEDELEEAFMDDETEEFDYARARELNGLPPLRESDYLPAPPQNDEEVFAAMWPGFDKNAIPKFQQLLPPKSAQYVGKQPLKPPKPLHLTKVTLDVAQDQAKGFRAPGSAAPTRAEIQDENTRKGLIPVLEPDTEEISDEDYHSDEIDPEEKIGGVTWQDLQVLCEDWDVDAVERTFETADHRPDVVMTDDDDDDLFGENADWDVDTPAAKRQKTTHLGVDFFSKPRFDFTYIDNPEAGLARAARRVALDLNDPNLLIEYLNPESESKNKATSTEVKAREPAEVAKKLNQRFNISNDEAYDQLKENTQSKVRSTLGTMSVVHSEPALKLQYPFYKVELETREARSFHRPALDFLPNMHIVFDKPKHIKRKHLKGKDVKTIYAKAEDLSLADNSNVVLFEYSEEYPTMISNFGMGNRIINYHRKAEGEGSKWEKPDTGEPFPLFAQDRSPFANFGTIDTGETVPTLHNSMYRAPLFPQPAKKTDFLVIRSETGIGGKHYYMRNIDNLFTVGQEFPNVEVPGPHARKVTTAQKNRMKMLAFRMSNKSRDETVDMQDITKHIRDSTDMQNRQKMKEFMKYNKDLKQWGMKPDEPLPDEKAIRAMVKPEDVCLIESMQVGKRHLQDAGYGKDVDELEDDDAKEGESLEKQLAPWNTTKNFLNATQNKAMLQLHGEGDPSGRGEAFSFLKTSMKGGFKALGESVEDKIEAKRQENDGGHKYNVARQAKAYEESIERIWEAQKTSLSSQVENLDTDFEDAEDEDDESAMDFGRTPRSEAQTPGYGHRDDETASQFSKLSNASQRGKVLRIRRTKKHPNGQIEETEDIVRNPNVIRQYIKRRVASENANINLSEIKPTGDPEQDKRNQKRIAEELARLEKNKDRRLARDKQKGIFIEDGTDGTPGSPNSQSIAATKSAGTSRKCANCGQVGHIKTNKKLCPMLNGTMKPGDGFAEGGFGSMAAPSPSIPPFT